MIVSIRMTEEEKKLAETYAKLNGTTLSESIKKAYIEKIEDEYDVALAKEALKEYEKNPKTYSLKEMKELLGLWWYNVGDYRIFAIIVDDKLIILIVTIGRRREIYDKWFYDFILRYVSFSYEIQLVQKMHKFELNEK